MTQSKQDEIMASLHDMGVVASDDSADDVVALATAVGLKGFERKANSQDEIVSSLREMGLIAAEEDPDDIVALGQKHGIQGFAKPSQRGGGT